jgi:hypothetical protein
MNMMTAEYKVLMKADLLETRFGIMSPTITRWFGIGLGRVFEESGKHHKTASLV